MVKIVKNHGNGRLNDPVLNVLIQHLVYVTVCRWPSSVQLQVAPAH